MRNLVRIALVLSFAACGESANNLPDPCEENPSLPECQLVLSCQDDVECDLAGDDPCLINVCENLLCGVIDTCDSVAAGDATLSINSNGAAFFATELDDSSGFDAFLDAEQAQLGSIPVGTCVETPFIDIVGEPARKPMGTVQLSRDGITLIELTPNSDVFYEDLLDPGVINPGDLIDYALTGAGSINPTSLISLFRVPPALPQLTGVDTGTGLLPLGQTVSFEPIVVDHLLLRFDLVEGQEVTSFSCRFDPASGTFTFDDTMFARLPQSAPITLTAFNRTTRILDTNDGVVRTMRGTVRGNHNIVYEKAP